MEKYMYVYVYIYIYKLLCCTSEINTLYINYTSIKEKKNWKNKKKKEKAQFS